MVKVASAMSAGRNFPARARSATSRAAGCNFSQGCGVRIWNHGGDYAVIDGDGHAHVHVGVQTDSMGAPAGVQPRMLQQYTRYERDQQIGVSDAHAALLVDLCDDALAVVVERAGLDLAAHEEVRHGRPALRGAFRHQTADRGWNFDAGRFFFRSCDA